MYFFFQQKVTYTHKQIKQTRFSLSYRKKEEDLNK